MLRCGLANYLLEAVQHGLLLSVVPQRSGQGEGATPTLLLLTDAVSQVSRIVTASEFCSVA